MIHPELVINDGIIYVRLASEERDGEHLHELSILDTTFLDGAKEGGSSVLRFLSDADLIALRDWLNERLAHIEQVKHVSRYKLPL